jgi:hypothetical protein
MTKYTSGPWAVGYGSNNSDDYATITSRFQEHPIAQLEPLGYSQANARLIAAAPELLEALKLTLPQLAHPARCGFVRPSEEWVEHGSMNFDNCSCEIAAVKAAIAKAEGAL